MAANPPWLFFSPVPPVRRLETLSHPLVGSKSEGVMIDAVIVRVFAAVVLGSRVVEVGGKRWLISLSAEGVPATGTPLDGGYVRGDVLDTAGIG